MLLACFVSVLGFFIWKLSVLFCFVLAFELNECCTFLCWVVLLLARLLARFHGGVVYAGVGLSWLLLFCFRASS